MQFNFIALSQANRDAFMLGCCCCFCNLCWVCAKTLCVDGIDDDDNNNDDNVLQPILFYPIQKFRVIQ